MKKILITGANGFLGSNLARFFSDSHEYSVILTSQKFPNIVSKKNLLFFPGNLLDEHFLDFLLHKEKPDVIINTVSLVNVDLCEEKPELARKITVQTAKNLAYVAKKYNSRLVYISTDQLFDGNKSMYTEEDIPNPINEYGRVKRDAELVTMQQKTDSVIVRTNFFGWSPLGHVPTFGEWVYKSLVEKKPINLFTNFFFSPIDVTHLARALTKVMGSNFQGTLNVVGSQRCSKYEFGITLALEFGLDPSIITPIMMNPDTMTAKRPLDMSLSIKKFETKFNAKLPSLKESLLQFKLDQPL